MYFLLAIIGLGWLAMVFVAAVNGSWLGAAVLVAALLVFVAFWKWKRSIPEDVWKKSRFKHWRTVRMTVGIPLFILAMIDLGIVARTFWANYFGEASDSADATDIYSGVLLTIFALAVLGCERVAGILFFGLLFSTTLAAACLRMIAGPERQASGLAWTMAFALAIGIVFGAGHWFRWSKGFVLAGLISIAVAGLGVYLTM